MPPPVMTGPEITVVPAPTPTAGFSTPIGLISRQNSWSELQPVEPADMLREQRMRTVPPLPRALRSLRQGLPTWEEVGDPVPGFPPAQVGPQRPGAFRPLRLRARAGAATAEGLAAQLCASSASTSASSSGWPASDGACRPFRVGVLFGGGGTKLPTYPVNVLEGLMAYLSAAAPGSRVVGFKGGPPGLLEGRATELSHEDVAAFRNQSAWQLLGYGTCSDGGFSPRERGEEARRAAGVCATHRLDSLVVVAGPRDLSWACALGVHFAKERCDTTVVGVPFSKNCSLYVPHYLPVTLGFDSARRTLSEVAGTITIDSLSSKKYYHFIRCGEDALTMEVALQTRSTFSVLKMDLQGEAAPASEPPAGSPESSPKGPRATLTSTVQRLQEMIERRRASGRHSGVVLLSRRLIETLPEMDILKAELVDILGQDDSSLRSKPPCRIEVERQLRHEPGRELFKRLPRIVQMSLITRRDAEGMPLLPTDLEAERILGRFVQQNLKAAKVKAPFAPRFHSLEFMTVAPYPSPFDCAYGYTLGHVAGALIRDRRTLYFAACANMHQPVDDWEPSAVPFSQLYAGLGQQVFQDDTDLEIPRRSWAHQQALLEAYHHFLPLWVECNAFKSPGPVQFGDGGDVGPMADRPFVLLAEYVGVEELKRLIQPVPEIPPAARIITSPLVVRDVRSEGNLSFLEQRRLRYEPEMPAYLRGQLRAEDEVICPLAADSTEGLSRSFPLTYGQSSAMRLVPSCPSNRSPSRPRVQALEASAEGSSPQLCRPRRIGVVFASNQAPGFHSVIAGLFDYLSGLSPPAEVVGFPGGFEGLIKGYVLPITRDIVDQYRNLGGQDMLCFSSEAGSLGFKDHLKAVTATIRSQKLDALMLIGNPEAQVDAAFITEACAAERLETCVIGIPVSIDCDFPFVQQTIGYDTVCRTLSAYIGQLGCLAQASKNLWILVRIPGNAWSHIAVQCTLQAHPNIVLLSGSQLHGQCLPGIVKSLCDLIVARHESGHNYGVVLLPMGFIQDVTELRLLFAELVEILEKGSYEMSWDSIPAIASKLEPCSSALFDLMPRDVQYEICFGGRERQTNQIHLASISTDRLILRFVEIELQRRRELGLIQEDFFRGASHPMLHHARSSLPSCFDCDLGYTLGWGAAILACMGKTGLLVRALRVDKSVQEWRLGAIPLTSLLRARFDDEAKEYMILPACVQLLRQRGIQRPFKLLPPMSERCSVYRGPIQFWGEAAADPALRTTWFMENMPLQDPTGPLTEISALCNELQSMMAQAKAESTLYAVNCILSNAVSILDAYKGLDASSRRSAQSLADVPMEIMPQVWRTKIEEALRQPRREHSHSPQQVPHGTGTGSSSCREPRLLRLHQEPLGWLSPSFTTKLPLSMLRAPERGWAAPGRASPSR